VGHVDEVQLLVAVKGVELAVSLVARPGEQVGQGLPV
jgi:hypothetical protein